ncbi:AAA family ATPase [Paraconexibacter sp. AEG42_29]|uniref:ATP-binding protein n=1 Tax=Paraconexibacter sp. AEG42_29 TaxID=2997339 RepID=UPI00339DA12E
MALLERDGEGERLRALLAAAARGDGCAAVILGSGGIGKTSLLERIRDEARATGAEVLTARGAELDRSFAFGVVRQLLEQRLHLAEGPARAALLKGAARHAVAILGDVPEHNGDEPPVRALHGLYWLLANLAAERTVVLCVDDIQWADRASLRWLMHVTRRLEGLRALLVLAGRPAEPGSDLEPIDALTAEAEAVLRPGALGTASVMAVLREELGTAPDSVFAAACAHQTGGNPLLVRALVDHLRRRGIAPVADAVGLVDEAADEDIARTVRRRLAGLDGAATSVARAVAILGDGATVREVATLSGLDEAVVRGGVADLAAVDVLAPRQALGFVHPLVRTAVYQDIAAVQRAAQHAAAARQLRAACADEESVARHLLRADGCGDAAATDTLLAAGRTATRRGAPDQALPYLERALLEPPPAAALADVLTALGTCEALLRVPGFAAHLQAAAAAIDDPVDAAGVEVVLADAQIAVGRFSEGFGSLDRAYRAVPADGDLARAIEAAACTLGQVVPSLLTPAWEQRIRLRAAQYEAGESLDPMTLAGLVPHLLRAHAPVTGALRALAGARIAVDAELARGGVMAPTLLTSAALGLANVGQLAEGGALLDRFIAVAEGEGASNTLAPALAIRAEISLHQGRVQDAESEVRAALMHLRLGDLGVAHGDHVTAWAHGALGLVLAERGHHDEAARAFAALPPEVFDEPTITAALLLTARAAIRSAQGDRDGALADLRAAGAFTTSYFPNPISVRWRSPASLLLTAGGDREAALALADEELALSHEWGVAVPAGRARVARGVALGGPEGVAELRAAVAALAVTEARLEHARALIELGAALRRSGSRAEAREPLREGLDRATRCGAVREAARAGEELLAAGARPRRDRQFLRGPESLTAGELRVARLAAEGLTNRQIAERLFVTQAAVQWHLRNTFRKLDITARGALADALSSPEGKAYGVPHSDPPGPRT